MEQALARTMVEQLGMADERSYTVVLILAPRSLINASEAVTGSRWTTSSDFGSVGFTVAR
jgi:hypothetical protein